MIDKLMEVLKTNFKQKVVEVVHPIEITNPLYALHYTEQEGVIPKIYYCFEEEKDWLVEVFQEKGYISFLVPTSCTIEFYKPVQLSVYELTETYIKRSEVIHYA